MWSIEFTEDFNRKYTEILTHAQTVCTGPFPPPRQKRAWVYTRLCSLRDVVSNCSFAEKKNSLSCG